MKSRQNTGITGETRLYAVIGNPVRHSLSPALQSRAFAENDIDAVMLAFEADTENLPEVVNSMKTLGAKGWNVTMPCKNRMAQLCDRLSREAELTGSVNTVENRDGVLTGHSTDGIGFIRHIRASGLSPEGKVIIAGAGGAAASIAAALTDTAREVVIANRTFGKAQTLAEKLNAGLAQSDGQSADHPDSEITQPADRPDQSAGHPALVRAVPLGDAEIMKRELADADLFVNAGSAGMAPYEDRTPLEDLSLLPGKCAVADIVYNPRQTRLLREAAEAGRRTCGGLGMLVQQGAEAFEIWTGQKFPIHNVAEAVLNEPLY